MVKKDYTLRKAIISDRNMIYELKKSSIRFYVEEIWGWDEDYQVKDFDNDFKSIGQFYVIEDDNRFIGFLQVYEHDKYIELVEIHLVPEVRGFGIGSSIIKSTICDAKNTDRTVRLGCFRKNLGAKSLYMRLGFEKIAETETHYIFEYRE